MSGNNVFFLIIVSLLIFASSSLIYDAEAYYSEAEQKEIPYVIRDLSVIPNTADSSIMVKIDMENMSTENKGPDKIRFRVYEGWRQEIVLMERKYMLGYDDVSGSGEITIKFSHDLAFGDYLAVIELYEDERNIRINRIPFSLKNTSMKSENGLTGSITLNRDIGNNVINSLRNLRIFYYGPLNMETMVTILNTLFGIDIFRI